MAKKYIFSDEAGCFTFRRAPNISKYFIVCTLTTGSCDVGHSLLNLRRKLVWDGAPLGNYFHASTDKQIVRDAVFEEICKHPFFIQATIMEKSKARPQVSISKDRVYKTGWYFHFKHSLEPHTNPNDEYQITAASIGTKKSQAVFTNAVNDVIQQHLPRDQWATFFCAAAADPCLQVVDYCTWAIQRKWERGDVQSYNLIKDRITYEYDLWSHGTKHQY